MSIPRFSAFLSNFSHVTLVGKLESSLPRAHSGGIQLSDSSIRQRIRLTVRLPQLSLSNERALSKGGQVGWSPGLGWGLLPPLWVCRVISFEGRRMGDMGEEAKQHSRSRRPETQVSLLPRLQKLSREQRLTSQATQRRFQGLENSLQASQGDRDAASDVFTYVGVGFSVRQLVITHVHVNNFNNNSLVQGWTLVPLLLWSGVGSLAE